jgi:hypothetical protein
MKSPILLLGILLLPVFATAQKAVQLPSRSFHQEKEDNAYMAPANKGTAPSPRLKTAGFTMVQVNVDANGNNILGDAANEPSMAIDPADPQKMVIGWRQFDNVLSNFRQAGYGYTTNSGQSWTFPGVITPGIFRSDPVLDWDASSNIFYNSLTSNSGVYTCKVFKSTNGGMSWDAGVDTHGGDKQWMAIDRSGGPGDGNLYAAWNSYFSSCLPGFFTRSEDNGGSFGDCTEIPGFPYWGTMAVGNNGEMYVSGWSDGFLSPIVTKSDDAQNPGSTPTWNAVMVSLDGMPIYGQLINPVGLSGQVNIAVDRSSGSSRDNVYVLCSVQRFSVSDSADVMFSRSTDGGTTWSTPVRVNDDAGNDSYQWFGTMSVAPNGRIDATWLDTRDSPPGQLLSALYYSYSTDQGITWSANQKLSPLFDSRIGWPQQAKMGDYVEMISDNSSAMLAWTNTLNGEQDVYFSRITPGSTGILGNSSPGSDLQLCAYPCPFTDKTTISYYIPADGFCTLSLFDVCGKEIRTLFSGFRSKGMHASVLAGTDLPYGYFIARLTVAGKSRSTAVVHNR